MASYNSEKSLKMRNFGMQKLLNYFITIIQTAIFRFILKLIKKKFKNFKFYFYYLIFKFKGK